MRKKESKRGPSEQPNRKEKPGYGDKKLDGPNRPST